MSKLTNELLEKAQQKGYVSEDSEERKKFLQEMYERIKEELKQEILTAIKYQAVGTLTADPFYIVTNNQRKWKIDEYDGSLTPECDNVASIGTEYQRVRSIHTQSIDSKELGPNLKNAIREFISRIMDRCE